MKKYSKVKNRKKMCRLPLRTLAACAISSTLVLANGGTVFASFDEPVYGGWVITEEQSVATVNGKTVSIPGGEYTVDVYTTSIAGGYVDVKTLSQDNVAITNGNTVTITGGTFRGSIAGGFVSVEGGKAQADNNTVKISASEFVSQSNSDIYGGYAQSLNHGNAQANGNAVEIGDIKITVRLDGKENNSILLNRNIYGGYATCNGYGSTTANDNKLTISGANIELMPDAEGYSGSVIYAGYATNGKTNTANKNTLVINGVTIKNFYGDERLITSSTEIGGGRAFNGTANENKVIITSGTIGENDKNVHVYAGNGEKAANSNEVVIDGSVTIFGDVVGGYGSGPSSLAEGNAVTIVTGTVTGDVYGGKAPGGTLKGNQVTVAGGTITGDVYGGYNSEEQDVDGNEVTITKGTVTGNVYGGFSNYNGVVKNNSVVVAGGTVDGDVIGGATSSYAQSATPNSSLNSLTLGDAKGEGIATVTGDVYVQRHEVGEIYDLYDEDKIDSLDGAVIAVPGGTLNVNNTGNSVGGNLNAPGAEVNFMVKEGEVNGTKPMLKVEGKAELSNANVVAHVDNLGAVENASLNLLQAAAVNSSGATYIITDGLLDNSSLGYDAETGTIKAEKIDPSKTTVNENAKSPAETQIVGVALVNATMDTLAGEGFSEAAKATQEGSAGEMQLFATLGGNHMRQNSGSHVDIKSWNAGLGLAKAVENKSGRLLFGPIAQYGRGNYDSYLNNGTKGSGKSSFYGFGGMVKQENNNGLYFEGSLLLGRLKNDYLGNSRPGMSYDDSANFYAMHAGLGKVQKLNKAAAFDYYGKLFFTHQKGNSVSLGSGHIYDFDNINSVRSRVGLRYTYKVAQSSEFSAGMAWQHEFDSKVQATIHTSTMNIAAPAPGVKGETGIFELGWTEKPVNRNMETKLGLFGSIGKQKGVGFSAQLKWEF